MKHPRPSSPGKFIQFSLACDCDPDRLIQDQQGALYCGECMKPLERVDSRELPERDRAEILAKLKLRKRIATREAAGGDVLWAPGDNDDRDDSDE